MYCNTLEEPGFIPLAEGTANATYVRPPYHVSSWAGSRDVNGSDVDIGSTPEWWNNVAGLY